MNLDWVKANKKLLIAAWVVLYVVSVLYNLGYTELDGEEPRRALISIEMLEHGNYFAPTLYGWDYYNKPPVFNWVMSLIFFLTGSTHEWAVRLPSLIFILIWAFAHYKIARRFLPVNVAALSSLFLLTGGEIYFYGLQNGGEIDIFYAFLVYLQVISLFYFYEKQNWLWLFVGSYLFCAISFLTKGIPSLVFQVFTLVALAFYARSIRVLLKWQHIAGVLVFAAITGAFLFLYSLENPPSRLLINFLQETLKKTPLHEAKDEAWGNIIGYPLAIFKGLLPWSILFFALLNRKIRVLLWKDKLVRFAILFIACNVWIYWFGGMLKLRYSYVLFPFFTTILAALFFHFQNNYAPLLKTLIKKGVYVFILLLAGILAVPFFLQVQWGVYIFSVMLLAAFCFFYLRSSFGSIVFFATGVVLLRLVYAMLLLPLITDGRKSTRYKPRMYTLAKMNHKDSLIFYAPPDTLGVKVDLKFWNWQLEQIAVAPEIFKQAPYYYHKATHKIVTYDTAIYPGKKYFSYRSFLQGQNINELYSFFDNRMNDEFVYFELAGRQTTADSARAELQAD